MMGLLALDLVPDFSTAAGTTLVSILPPLSVFAAHEYYKQNKINLEYAFILMFVCTLGGWLGAKMNTGLPDHILKRILAGYLFLVGIHLVYSSFNKNKH